MPSDSGAALTELELDSFLRHALFSPEWYKNSNLSTLLSTYLSDVSASIENARDDHSHENYLGNLKTEQSIACGKSDSMIEEYMNGGGSTETCESTVEPNADMDSYAPENGRVGPQEILLINKEKVSGAVQALKLSAGDLSVASQCNFASVIANTCVYSGKWMYEVTLLTGGLQQIGWCTADTGFTDEEGVGDSSDSFAYDGMRVRCWNKRNEVYGEEWRAGDVIGVCIDLPYKEVKGEESEVPPYGTISFYRNGKHLGVAFSKVIPMTGYFPAASLSIGEKCTFNFGAFPIQFPVAGFRPLHAPPSHNLRLKAALCARLYLKLSNHLFSGCSACSFDLATDDALIIADHIFDQFPQLLTNPFYVHAYLYELAVELNSNRDAISQLIRHLLVFSSPHHTARVLSNFINVICQFLRISGYTSSDGEKTIGDGPHRPLSLFLSLCMDNSFLSIWTHMPDFDVQFEALFLNKQPNTPDLDRMFPYVYWKGAPADAKISLEKMKVTSGELSASFKKCDSLRVQILRLFLDDRLSLQPPRIFPLNQRLSRSEVLISFLRGGISVDVIASSKDISLISSTDITRDFLRGGQSDRTVLVSLFSSLVLVLEESKDIFNPSDFPFDRFRCEAEAAVEYFDFPRCGGLISFLSKQEFSLNIGPLDESVKYCVDEKENHIRFEIFDIAMIFYHLVMQNTYKRAIMASTTQVARRAQYDDIIDRIQRFDDKNINGKSLTDEEKEVLMKSEERSNLTFVLAEMRNQLESSVRVCEWNDTKLTRSQMPSICNALESLLKLLLEATKKGQFLTLVPELYLENAIDWFNVLRRLSPSSSFMSENPKILDLFTSLIVVCFVDDRIVKPDLKDNMLKSIAVLVRDQDSIERNLTASNHLVPNLMKAFNSNMWINVVGIFLQFWKGRLFCEEKSGGDVKEEIDEENEEGEKIYIRPNDGTRFSQHFRHFMIAEPDTVAEFLNRLMNTLGTAMTELTLALQEANAQALSGRGRSLQMSQIHRKVLVWNLLVTEELRLLEITCLESPYYVYFHNQEVNLSRLAEIINHVFNSYTVRSPPSCFDYVFNLGLKSATIQLSRQALLAPIAGCIVNLVGRRNNYHNFGDYSSVLADALTSDPAIDIDHTFKAIRNYTWEILRVKDGAVIAEQDDRVIVLNDFIDNSLLRSYDAFKKREEEKEKEAGDGSLCVICCVGPDDCTFVPCGHHSCHKCISRHLLNSRRCFFCNAEVTSVEMYSNETET